MSKFLAGCQYNEEEISRHLKKNIRYWPVEMNGNKFATGQILKKPVEVAKGRILAGWAQQSPEPCFRAKGMTSKNHNLETKQPWSPYMNLRATHFTHKTASPWPLHFKHSHWWKRRSRSKFASHYAWGTNGVCEYKMDVIVYMDSYMASNESCFMVTWTIFKNYLLDVGLTQNRETTPLWMLTTVDLFYFILCEDPHEHKLIEIAFSWRPDHIWLHTTLKDLWRHYMIVEVCWDGLWTLFFWALTISWSRLLACVGNAPKLLCFLLFEILDLHFMNL